MGGLGQGGGVATVLVGVGEDSGGERGEGEEGVRHGRDTVSRELRRHGPYRAAAGSRGSGLLDEGRRFIGRVNGALDQDPTADICRPNEMKNSGPSYIAAPFFFFLIRKSLEFF